MSSESASQIEPDSEPTSRQQDVLDFFPVNRVAKKYQEYRPHTACATAIANCRVLSAYTSALNANIATFVIVEVFWWALAELCPKSVYNCRCRCFTESRKMFLWSLDELFPDGVEHRTKSQYPVIDFVELFTVQVENRFCAHFR